MGETSLYLGDDQSKWAKHPTPHSTQLNSQGDESCLVFFSQLLKEKCVEYKKTRKQTKNKKIKKTVLHPN